MYGAVLMVRFSLSILQCGCGAHMRTVEWISWGCLLSEYAMLRPRASERLFSSLCCHQRVPHFRSRAYISNLFVEYAIGSNAEHESLILCVPCPDIFL